MAYFNIEHMEFSHPPALVPETVKRAAQHAVGWMKDVGGKRNTIDFVLTLDVPVKKKSSSKHRKTSKNSSIKSKFIGFAVVLVLPDTGDVLDLVDSTTEIKRGVCVGPHKQLSVGTNGSSSLQLEAVENGKDYVRYTANVSVRIETTSAQYKNSPLAIRFETEPIPECPSLAVDSEEIFAMTKVRKDPLDGGLEKVNEVDARFAKNAHKISAKKRGAVSKLAQQIASTCGNLLGMSPSNRLGKLKVKSEPASPLLSARHLGGASFGDIDGLYLDEFMTFDLDDDQRSTTFGLDGQMLVGVVESDVDFGHTSEYNYETDSTMASQIHYRPQIKQEPSSRHHRSRGIKEEGRSHKSRSSSKKASSRSHKSTSSHKTSSKKSDKSRSDKRRSKRHRSSSGDKFLKQLDDAFGFGYDQR